MPHGDAELKQLDDNPSVAFYIFLSIIIVVSVECAVVIRQMLLALPLLLIMFGIKIG